MDKKSISEYLTFVRGNLVTWKNKNKKQNMVSLSSVKVEYNAFHHAIIELFWLKIMLRDYAIIRPKEHMMLFCDNTITIKIVNNSI